MGNAVFELYFQHYQIYFARKVLTELHHQTSHIRLSTLVTIEINDGELISQLVPSISEKLKMKIQLYIPMWIHLIHNGRMLGAFYQFIHCFSLLTSMHVVSGSTSEDDCGTTQGSLCVYNPECKKSGLKSRICFYNAQHLHLYIISFTNRSRTNQIITPEVIFT